MDPALSLERFATVSAELDAGAPRDQVLAREGLTLDAWTAAQEAWLLKLANEVATNRFELTTRYNAVFMKRRQTLENGSNPGAEKKRVVQTPPPDPVPRALVQATPAPTGAASAPFVAAPAPAAPSKTPAPPADAANQASRHTLALLVQTEPDAMSPVARPGSELPFRKPTPAPSFAITEPLPEPLPGTQSPFPPPLPFREAPGPRNGDRDRPTGTAASMSGLPFRPAASATREPRFTLEQLASLAAEIAQNPTAIAQVRARYHLSEAAHLAEFAAWQRRFAADQTLYARYVMLFRSYRDWLARSMR